MMHGHMNLKSNTTVYWYIYNYKYMGYMFRLYRVIFRLSKTTDPIGSVVFEVLKMTR